MGAEAIAADVLDVVGTIGTSVAPNVPGPAGIVVRVLSGIASFVAGALRGGLSPDQAIERCRSALAVRDAVDARIDGEIARRTACRTCGGKGFVGVAPCPDCKKPIEILWGHEE